LPKIIAGLLVGGVIEEVMMRLFFMSMLVLIISKLFYKNEKDILRKINHYIINKKDNIFTPKQKILWEAFINPQITEILYG